MEVKPGYKRTEVGVIPEDWAVRLLPEVLRFRGGKAHEQHISETGRYICVNSKFISTDGKVRKYTSANFCPAKKGDVLMVMSDLPNGRALAKAYLVEYDDIYAVNQRVCALTAYRDCPEYFFYALNRHPYFLKFDDGVSQTHLLNDVFQKCPIPVPPNVAEQRAIAAALGDVDALLGGLDRLIVKKRDLKQAAMQQLLAGQTRLPGFNGEWEVKRLGEVVQIQKGQLMTSSTLLPGDIPVIAGGKQPAYFHAIANRYGRTITISASGASAGYVALYNEPVFASDCSTISESKAYCLDFVFYQLLCKQQSIYKAQTGGAQPHIHAKDLNPILFLLPTVAEQIAIAAVLSNMDAELAALQARRDKTRDLKQAMMQELLTGRTRLV
jgi:type I restriction enzyme S subunit